MATSAPDVKDHYGVIIIGAGFSGLAMNIQLKRKLGYKDIMVYEAAGDVGGTWYANQYPGAGVDIPFEFYTFSFAPFADFSSSWPLQPDIMRYFHYVVKKFNVNNVVFKTAVVTAKYSKETALWTVQLKDLVTGVEKTRTCTVLISAVGGLREPVVPDFASDPFDGAVFHSARWNHKVSLEGKDVVVVGNGCSAAQTVPYIVDRVKRVTQIARTRQTIFPYPTLPDNAVYRAMLKWVPGFLWFMRAAIFFMGERDFKLMDVANGKEFRKQRLGDVVAHAQNAPEKYRASLMPDFEVGAKRRIFDPGYVKAMSNPKFRLIQDDSCVHLKGNVVVTKKGEEVPADVVVLCTGFKAQAFLYPLMIYNDEGESLVDRFNSTYAKCYRGTFASGFPNFAFLMGPNTTTGHSSVIFTSECQVTLILKVIAPVLANEKKHASISVTREAEDEYFAKVRSTMKNRIWEKEPVGWYVQDEGKCTTLYPWSQVNFWWNTLWPVKSHYKTINCAL